MATMKFIKYRSDFEKYLPLFSLFFGEMLPYELGTQF